MEVTRYMAGAVLVRSADEGARVALVLLALQRAGSAAVGGVLVAAQLVPHVVAAPVAGALTDRARRPRRVVAGAALGFAAALASASLLLGRVPLGVVVAALLAGGACGPVLTGGLTSQLAALVPEAALPRAFALDSLSYNVAGIAGPAAAGGVAAIAGSGAATVALAASAALGAAVAATLPIGDRPRAGRGDGPPLRAGAVALVRDRILRTVTLTSALGQLGPGALPVVAAVAAARLQAPAASGPLLTAVAAGGLAGSLLWAWRPAASRHAPAVVMASMVGVGVPLGLGATEPSLAVLAALFALSGMCLGPFAGALFITRQDHAPAGARAQVFTLGAGIKTTAAAAGAVLAGTVAHASTPALFLLVAASPVLAGVSGLALLRRSMRIPHPRKGVGLGT